MKKKKQYKPLFKGPKEMKGLGEKCKKCGKPATAKLSEDFYCRYCFLYVRDRGKAKRFWGRARVRGNVGRPVGRIKADG